MSGQTEQPVTENDDVSFLSMSDEEVMAMGIPTFTEEAESDEGAQMTGDSQSDDTEAEEDSDVEDSEEETDTEEESTDETEEGDTDEAESDEETDTETEKEESGSEPKEKSEKSEEVDYKTFFEKITAPFMANGREMKIDKVEDAIQLMQMGAGYNKKMAALKPNLKLLKLLENNKLLDEQKLSYLIDLDKKNPAAIAKLVKESGIDPMDIDTEKESEYTPQTYTVNDQELALDEVIGEIRDTPTFNKTIDLVSNKWDGPSKRIVAENPQLLSVINGHMANGIYDVISNEVEKERTFGRLNGLSDLEAYRKVGDALNARGGFDHLFQQRQDPEQPTSITPKPASSKNDPHLKTKKRAASSTKPAKQSAAEPNFNPLAMSDEEFSKLGLTKFL